MASNSAISIGVKVEDVDGGFKQLSFDSEAFKKIIKETVVEAEKLKKPMINFAATATGIDSINKSFSALQGVIKELTGAYAAQIEAETKLAVNMRNTMGAREKDIQSIKDLCAAQQEIGIIGDEVQLAGAQELATYLREKQSLEKLIPVMNDMLAQQYGLNATQENAAQIATMLGKVMDGQVGALSRYGYKFDEAQEKILKYGTEAQRVAVLCDVVSSAVGGMNAELAKTDIGKQKQLENKLGDIKETIGGIVQVTQPWITYLNQVFIASGNIVKIGVALRTLKDVTQKCIPPIKDIKEGLSKVGKTCDGVSLSAKGLTMALQGLLKVALVGAAIWGVIKTVEYFTSSTDDATDALNKFADAEERAKREAEANKQQQEEENAARNSAISSIELNIAKLKEFHGSKEQEKKIVNEMNDTYGDTMGYFSSVADWYKALVSNSEAYCKQMVTEARTRILANRIAEKQQEIHDIRYDESGQLRRYNTKRDKEFWSKKDIAGTSDLDKANAAIKADSAAIADLKKQLSDATKEAAGITFNVKGSETRPDLGSPKGGKGSARKATPQLKEDASNLKEIGDNISYLQDKLKTASEEEAALINQQIDSWQKKADAIRNAGKAVEFKEDASNLKDIGNNISILQGRLQTASKEEAALINQQITAWQEKANAIRNAGRAAELKEDAANLKEIGNNISILQDKLQTASKEEAALINQQITAWQEKADAISDAGKAVKSNDPVFRANAKTLAEITENINALTNELNSAATIDEASLLNQQIQAWEKKADAIRNAGLQSESAFEKMRNGYQSIKGITGGVENITEALQGNGNAWQRVTGIIDGFLQIYDGVRAVVDIINAISQATKTQSVATATNATALTAETTAMTANTVAASVNTSVKSGEAVAEATASGAKLPFPANIAAIAAAVAAVVGALSVVGSFATGGIVGGNSRTGDKLLARVNSGEMILNLTQQRRLFSMLGGTVSSPRISYFDDRRRPNIELPFDKLRSLIEPTQPMNGTIEFKIKGRRLVGIYEKETTHLSRL